MKNPLKEQLIANNPIIGIWSIVASPSFVEIGAAAGLGFQIFDMEHGVFDLSSIEMCTRACHGYECFPLVRIPTIDPSIIQNCLDIGVYGLVVPQINSHEDVLTFIDYASLPPKGQRGYNPFTRANNYNVDSAKTNFKLDNEFALLSIIVETLDAYNDLDKILEIERLDMVYLGVYDMSYALGVGGDVSSPKVIAFVEDCISKINKANKAVGLMVNNDTEFKHYLKLGVTCLVYGVDTSLYSSVINKGVKEFVHCIDEDG